MIVAIASGKGGTGKTLVATGLARVAMDQGLHPVHLLDCDVEAPNAHLFLHPVLERSEEVVVQVPQVIVERCTGCGRCSEVCAFHALAVVQKKVLVFPELCHGCGSCTVQCPEQAIREEPRRLGVVELGRAGELCFGRGVLDIGQAMATPIIRRLKQWAIGEAGPDAVVLLDAPPGNACSAVETLRGSDLALLVTEPTPFGLHDLEIAVSIARDELKIPVAVVVNRDGVGSQDVDEYCARTGVPIVARFPLDLRIARAYSDGQLWVDALPEYRPLAERLWQEISMRTGERR